jgi:hypothetical protein
MPEKPTTIKLSKATKERIDNLQVYPKEPYDRILTRILEILNICHVNPNNAKAMLIGIDRQRKINGLVQKKEPENKVIKEKIFPDGN